MINPDRALELFADMSASLHGELTALDQVSGDGDFGDNLRDALLRVVDRLHERSGATQEGNAFSVAGSVFLDTVGGTSGPLFGLLFRAIGRALDQKGVPAELCLAAGFADGLAAIKRVGEASPGDRTMVDALTPASDLLAAGGDLGAAADAAYEGARRTASMRARQGRASYIGNRALGSPDPGAIGVALLIRALVETQPEDRPWAWALSDLVSRT